MYHLTPTNNPSNWLGGIWIIVQYAVFRGLMNYGYQKEAAELCGNVMKLLGDDLRKTGTLHEYYNPETGEPVINGDFTYVGATGSMTWDASGAPTKAPNIVTIG